MVQGKLLHALFGNTIRGINMKICHEPTHKLKLLDENMRML